MGELIKINGRTPEEIKHTLAWTIFGCGGLKCDDCSYRDVCSHESAGRATADALALIEHLEAKVPRWISVEERLPEKEGDYLVRKVHLYSDNDGYSKIDVCIYCKMRDPEWIGCGNLCKVTHWMPLPSVEGLK